MPTWNLLDCLTKSGLKKFIYFSTIHVYGNLSGGIIYEDQIPQPSNIYGMTHLLSENICNYYNDKTETECINVRLSNTYGSPIFKENNCWWLVINELCKTAIENNEIRLKSDGSPKRDFIHGNDVAGAIDILINNKNNNRHNIFHIASEQTLTILELAHRVKSAYTKIFDKDIDIILPDNSLSKYLDLSSSRDIDRHIISTNRLRNLGFKEELDLELGIKEIFHYLNIDTV
jgi:UDP-glucose 4-epimerase